MNQTLLSQVELADWAKRFYWEAEILARRLDLFHPKNEVGYLSTLRWIAACGEERDLELIEIAKGIVRFQSKEADRLIREASVSIRDRHLSPLDLGRDVSGELKYPGPLAFVAHQNSLLVKRANSMSPEALNEWSLAHSAAAETLERRVQLVLPRTKTELLRALYWADALGEEADAQLLDVIPLSGMDVLQLRERATKSINRRLEAGRLMDELLTPGSEPKITVATDALRLGMRSRGTGAPRGNVIEPANVRVSWGDSERTQANSLLASRNTELRNQLALVLGEWGGEQEARALARCLREDWESKEGKQFARYCVAALKTIGGQTAVAALCHAIENGPEAIQLAALNAIEELVTGGSEIYGEGTPRFSPPRGRYPRGEPPAPGTERITDTLKRIMDTGSSAVRKRAKELLYNALV